MPEGERKPHIPEWAEKERLSDLAWIIENLPVFWPVASGAYERFGRGALVVDTTVQPEPDKGHPMAYFSRGQIGTFSEKEDALWQDTMRMVSEYDPAWEFVALLLKEQRQSVYRVGVPGLQPEERSGRSE